MNEKGLRRRPADSCALLELTELNLPPPTIFLYIQCPALPTAAVQDCRSQTSMPAALIPAFVASFTTSISGLYRRFNATVYVMSMIRPLIWIPESTFIMLSYARTVSLPTMAV